MVEFKLVIMFCIIYFIYTNLCDAVGDVLFK